MTGRSLCDIATRMGYPMSYETSQDIMEEIPTVTPSYAGITYDRIEDEGIHWPCPSERSSGHAHSAHPAVYPR